MKRMICVLLLGSLLSGCESGSGSGSGGAPGSGSEPSVDTGAFTLNASEKELVAAADGRPVSELLAVIGTIVGERHVQVKKNKLVAALDQAFEIRCHQNCEIQER